MLTERQLTAIGVELKKHREQLNQSIQDISRKMGVAPKCIVAIESGNLSYFAGAKSEITRLIKLYKRKLHLKADFLDSELPTLNQNNFKPHSEVNLPSFLLKTVSVVPRTLKKSKMPVIVKRTEIANQATNV